MGFRTDLLYLLSWSLDWTVIAFSLVPELEGGWSDEMLMFLFVNIAI